jgi:hypothetical protein
VEDKTAPAVEVKNTILALDGNGNAALALDSVRVSSTDNCGILAEVLSQIAFDCSHVGANAVTLTVTDNNGNVTQKTVTVTVVDKTAPKVQTQPVTLQLLDNGAALLTLNHVRVSSTDNCGIKSEELSQTAFGCDNLGENKVLLTVTDHNGNVSTAQVTVRVEDKTFPAINGMPANRTLLAGANCQAVASWMEPSFSDNCGIKISNVNHPSGSAFGLGVTTVTYTVEDNSGNVSEASFTVTVTNAAPQLTQINAPATPVAVINAVPVSIGFADNNLASAVIEWGDGSSSSYAAEIGTPVIAGSHTYAMPGLYSLKVTLTDACGAQASGTYEYVMVNAPADGFITGGGWINSPAGALVGTVAMGKASYSFNAKYNPATGVSSGSATFEFPAGALNLASTRIDWLVVADAKGLDQRRGYGKRDERIQLPALRRGQRTERLPQHGHLPDADLEPERRPGVRQPTEPAPPRPLPADDCRRLDCGAQGERRSRRLFEPPGERRNGYRKSVPRPESIPQPVGRQLHGDRQLNPDRRRPGNGARPARPARVPRGARSQRRPHAGSEPGGQADGPVRGAGAGRRPARSDQTGEAVSKPKH